MATWESAVYRSTQATQRCRPGTRAGSVRAPPFRTLCCRYLHSVLRGFRQKRLDRSSNTWITSCPYVRHGRFDFDLWRNTDADELAPVGERIPQCADARGTTAGQVECQWLAGAA